MHCSSKEYDSYLINVDSVIDSNASLLIHHGNDSKSMENTYTVIARSCLINLVRCNQNLASTAVSHIVGKVNAQTFQDLRLVMTRLIFLISFIDLDFKARRARDTFWTPIL